MSDKQKTIYEKLFEIRHELEGVQKDAENPFFKSEYVTLNGLLDVLNPHLKRLKILLLQPPFESEKDGNICVQTVFIDVNNPKEEVKFNTELPLAKKDPQAAGSAITYARRYALMSFFSLKAEDDDGNSATHEDMANMYQITEINKLAKELDLEDKLSEMLDGWGFSEVKDLTKDRATTVLERLRQVKKERKDQNVTV